MKNKISAEELEEAISQGLEFMIDEGELNGDRYSIQTFDESGLMTNDKGIVLKIGDQEFQITIVRSK